MATWGRREFTTVRVEFAVPATPAFGACWVEVQKAIAAAEAELRQRGLLKEGESAWDDQIRIEPGDDEIVVFYERKATQ